MNNPSRSVHTVSKHMNTQKTVASAAVEAINKQNHDNAVAKSIVIVKDIAQLLGQIDAQEANIESLQTELGKLSNSELTLNSVLGKQLPAALTETQKTVAMAVSAVVKSKQACVEVRATQLSEQIVSCTSSIKSINEALDKKRKELEEIKVEVVTDTDILSA